MLTLAVFILILSLLVLVHEFGHFIVAKKSGIKVEEFGLGLPPKIFGKKIGETLYSINLLPFGGFVKLQGEDSAEVSGVDSKSSFFAKSSKARLAVLCAGVTMNVILGIVLFYAFFFSNNFKSFTIPLFMDYRFRFGNMHITNTMVTSLAPDSPAKGLLRPGQAVLTVVAEPVSDVTELRAAIKYKVGIPVQLALDDGKIITIVPKSDTAGAGILGIYLGKSVYLSYDTAAQKLLSGPMHAYNMLSYSAKTFKMLILLSVQEKSAAPVSEGVSGPVGIYSVIGSILGQGGKRVILSLVDLTPLMSLSLAFLNIMPFPALDGGRAFFVVLEILRKGRKVSAVFEANVHKWGMILLLGFILLITLKDVARLIG